MLARTEEHVPDGVSEVRRLTIAVETYFRVGATEADSENFAFGLTFLNIPSHERAIG